MSINKTNSLDISGYFHYHTKCLKEYKNLFFDTFSLDQNLIDVVQGGLKKIEAKIIAVHVRAGDYVDLEKLNGGFGFTITPSFSEINTTIQNLSLMNKKSQQLIYLATDDLEYAAKGLASFGIDYITSKDIAPDGCKYSDLILDFCVLTLADVLLISNSSFSFSAAMLNKVGKSFFRPNINNKKYQLFDPWDDYILHSRARTLYV
jgi:hypothetical protein